MEAIKKTVGQEAKIIIKKRLYPASMAATTIKRNIYSNLVSTVDSSDGEKNESNDHGIKNDGQSQ